MLVSVVIPTYNCAGFLGEAIRSVLAQTFQDFEIIVIDDASTDDTQAALQTFTSRVRSIRQDRAGPSVARNRGILEAQGEWIAFLDADDLWRPTKLARQIQYGHDHPEAVLIYTDFTRGPKPGANNESRLKDFKPRHPIDSFHALLAENFIATPTVLVRRDALARSGLFDPSLRGSEDLELWLRLARIGAFGFVDEVLADVRQHPGNTTRSVAFVQEQIRAAQLMLTRWGDDPIATRLIRRRLGICSWNLAYAEQSEGHYPQARSAYWSSACHAVAARRSPLSIFYGWRMRESMPPIAGALARAALMSLPSRLITTARQWTRRSK
jgi:glycosyltransferase involved in cell wall biosynthesis